MVKNKISFINRLYFVLMIILKLYNNLNDIYCKLNAKIFFRFYVIKSDIQNLLK